MHDREDAAAVRTREAIARRPLPGRPLGPTAVQLAGDLLTALPPRSDAIVRITGPGGRSVWSRIEPIAAAGTGDTAEVRLGRLLWSPLGAKPGDVLSIALCPVPDARNVIVASGTVLTRAQETHVVATLRERRPPVWPTARLAVPTSGSGEPVVIQVQTVEPATGIVTPDTAITFDDADPSTAADRYSLADVGGLDDARARLRETLFRPLHDPESYWGLGIAPPRGVLLYGPPGTGKTMMARAVGHELQQGGVSVFAKAATELVGTYAGETEAHLRTLFTEAIQYAPSLVMLDEIDVLTTARSDLASQSDIRATSQFLSLLDGLQRIDGVVVLGTTNRVEVMDGAFRRPGRFDVELPIFPPDAAARNEILRIHTRDMPLTEAAEERLEELAALVLGGFTGADLMAFAREIGLAAYGRRTLVDSDAPTVSVERTDVESALERVAPSLLRGRRTPRPDRQLRDIAGLHEQKRQLAHAATGLPEGGCHEGVVVVGPSGNGKTLLVRAFAQELRLPLIEVDPAALFTQWLGRSEAAINDQFALARTSAPSILVLEHLDAIVPRRSQGARERADDRVQAALESAIDDTLTDGRVLIIGVTDDLERVEPSLVRRGRLGSRVEVGPPAASRRREIIERGLGETGRKVDGGTVAAMVETSEGMSAAALDAWIRERPAGAPPGGEPSDREVGLAGGR